MDVNFEKQGASLTVKPVGQMDSLTSPEINKLTRAKMDGITELILDMDQIDYISSGGLRVLLTWQQEMENRGGTFQVRNVNSFISDVFELTGLSDLLDIK